MSGALWGALGIVSAGGAVGGAVNAFAAAQGFILPGRVTNHQGTAAVWQPGILGTVLIGAFAAAVNWGLYGPFSSYFVYGKQPASFPVDVTLAALVTGSLIGFAGSKWLTNEVDKKLLRTVVAVAAADPTMDAATAARIATATPADSLHIVSGDAVPESRRPLLRARPPKANAPVPPPA